ncbi:MAG: ribose-phosphate pyrophosphokinase [Candidatus Marinimicrobia bacterium]|nr:ribose-phosphate pyrophosphokinase [Candidatus Neomarinimicrobiota bacterium]MCF7829050.1 ribose-phosphate pyrophosphokinase [Candidatus Neomarinimicrobiota bacterium]MCF7881813.1 ribose-phosphate pyrophosphokinase [Candidatus Neomarinimicrobiota bacterium]
MSVDSHPAKLFAGRSNPELAGEISEYLDLPLGGLTIKNFSDGEIWVKFEENIRGTDVFLIQSTNPPAENIIELLLMIDAAKRASAHRITAVIPYYGYARQDRKEQPRVPISARVMATLLTKSGADRVLTMDLHSTQIQGFFDIPFDHLYSKIALMRHIREQGLDDVAVLAPDVGSIPMARSYAKLLGASLAIIDKRRPEPNRSDVMNVIGELDGKDIFLIDDLVDTAGTLTTAAEVAMGKGARSVEALATHAVLSGPAVERIKNSPINELTVTNTLQIPQEKRFDKLTVISVGEVFGEAIRRIHEEESISSLFNF